MCPSTRSADTLSLNVLTVSADTDCPHRFYTFFWRNTRQTHTTLQGEKSWEQDQQQYKTWELFRSLLWICEDIKNISILRCTRWLSGWTGASYFLQWGTKFFRDILFHVQNYPNQILMLWDQAEWIEGSGVEVACKIFLLFLILMKVSWTLVVNEESLWKWDKTLGTAFGGSVQLSSVQFFLS